MSGFDKSLFECMTEQSNMLHARAIADALLNLNERLEKLEALAATARIIEVPGKKSESKPLYPFVREKYVSGGVPNEWVVFPVGRVAEVPKDAGKFVNMCEFRGRMFFAFENAVYRGVEKNGEFGLVRIAFMDNNPNSKQERISDEIPKES